MPISDYDLHYQPLKPKNLFKWNRIDLTRYDIPKWSNFPGTYILFENKKCIYIGQSSNIFARINRHLRLSWYSTCCWWLRRKEGEEHLRNIFLIIKKEKKEYERLMIEKRLIVRLKPKFNIKLKPII